MIELTWNWLKSFTIYSILIYSIRCQSDRPEILQNVGNIHLTFCSIFEKKIDSKAYYDRKSNDYNLKLELLNEKYQIINSSDLYLNFDPETKTIYAVHASNQNRLDFTAVERNYFIRATNLNGDFIDDNFTLTINGDSLPATHQITAELLVDNNINQKSDVEILYRFIKLLNEIYNTGVKEYNEIHVQNYTRIPSVKKLDVVFQNCTLQNEYKCESYLLKPLYQDGQTDSLSKGLEGYFQLNTISLINTSYCTFKSGSFGVREKDFQSLYKDKFTDFRVQQFPGINVSYINYYYFMYSERGSVFYPVIETVVSTLDSVRVSNEFPSQMVWRDKKMYHYFVIMTKWKSDLQKLVEGKYYAVCNFIVMQSNNKRDIYSGKIIFVLRQEIPENHNFYIKISFTNLQLKLYGNQPYSPYLVVNMYYFMQRLQLIFQRRYEIYLIDAKITNFETGSGYAEVGFLMTTTVCDYELIKQIQAEIYEKSDPKNVNTNFANEFSSTAYNISLEVTKIEQFYGYKCRKNPPKLTNELGVFEVGFCGIYKYTIPFDTFTDEEDGTDLKYNFLNKDGTKLSINSFVQFDSQTRIVSAILTESMSVAENLEFVYIVKATDTSNLTQSTELKVQLIGKPKEVIYRIQISGIFKNPSLYNPGFRLAEVIDSYTKSTDNTFQLILSATSSQNQHIIQFTSCKWDVKPCPQMEVSKYKAFFFDINGNVVSAFSNLISNDYNNAEIQQTYLSFCKNNNPPILQKPWGPHEISPCQSFSLSVPEETFYDEEQGFTRNLNLKMLTSSNTGDLPKWISFNEEKQLLTLVPYHETASLLRLRAYDVRNEYAFTSVIINNKFKTDYTVLIKMRFRVTNSSLAESFTTLYDYLRTKIRTYFRDKEDIATVEYISGSYPSTIYEVTWTNCSLSTEKCERDKIEYIRNMLLSTDTNGVVKNNLSFRDLMKTFQIEVEETLSVTESGVCLMKPIVVKALRAINLNYCGAVKFQIPEDTFQDPKDGKTRNLTLSLSDENNIAVNLSWISFKPDTQTLYAILTSQQTFSQRVYKFKIHATTKRLDSVAADLFINIIGNLLPSQPYLKFMFGYEPGYQSISFIGVTFLEAVGNKLNVAMNNLNAFSLSQETVDSYIIFYITVQECNLPCDKQKIRTIENESKYKELDPFYIYTFAINKENDCGPDLPPRIRGKLEDITVKQCGIFSYKIDAEQFDDEDLKLTFVITGVNGKPNNFVWIGLFNGVQVQGVITNDLLKEFPTRVLNISIRAYDRKNQFNETHFLITIQQDEHPQTFYKYSMAFKQTVTIETDFLDAKRQILVVEYLENYFKTENIVNIMSYEAIDGETFVIEWSVCNLLNKCTQNGLQETSAQIFVSQGSNQIKTEFSSIFQAYFQLASVTITSEEITKQAFTAPTATIQTKTISLAYCGGFTHQFDANLFRDEQQVNTRNLELYVETSRGISISSTYSFILYNQQTQTIYGIATYDEAANMNSKKQKITLRARDNCGLEASITVYFTFELPIRPPYTYIFEFTSTYSVNYQIRQAFMEKLLLYSGSSDKTSFGYISMSSSRIEMFNCSMSYSPCDLYALQKIKSSYSNQNNLPIGNFKNAMSPEFDILLVTSKIDNKCISPLPPVPSQRGPYNISICLYYTYPVPEDLFYDYQQGNARNLKITFSGGTNKDYTLQNNFDINLSNVQTADLIPTANLMNNQKESGYDFIVTATNQFNLKASTTIKLLLYGPYKMIQECQIQITLKLMSEESRQRSSVHTMIYVKKKLYEYFGMKDQNISIVTFSKTQDEFYFSFGYCYEMHTNSKSHSSYDSVYYYNFQKYILLKLFQEDRKTVATEFRNIFSGQYTVMKVEKDFSGRCSNLPPICTLAQYCEIKMYISYGGYSTYTYQRTLFYDYEDGWADTLSLHILNSQNKSVLIDNWVNIDFLNYKIYAVINDEIRFSSATRFIYYIQATDSKGLYTRIKLIVMKNDIVYLFAPFNFTYYLQYTSQSSSIYVKQSSYIIDSIYEYFNSLELTRNIITSRSMILMRWYYRTSGYGEYRVFYYSIANENCNSAILSYMKTIYIQETFNANLVASLTKMFSMKRFTIHTQCNLPPTPPPTPHVPVIIDPPLNISYCEIFYYTLPKQIFYDPQLEVDATKMNLELLDASGIPVTASSWLQLNKVTLQLYAIAIQSQVSTIAHMQQQSSHQFHLRATSSAGGEVTSSFTVNILNYPYTSDCYQNSTFKYKFESRHTTELDVAIEFVNKLTQYYGDKTTNVKIVQFRRISSASYYIEWANCSFQYQSLSAAKSGLTENERPQLRAIFNKVSTTSKGVTTVNQKFRQLLSTHFELMTFINNDNCIEEPPEPNSQVNYVFHTSTCELLNRSLPNDIFYDKRDGDASNLKLTMETIDGKPISKYEWIALDQYQHIYGAVTKDVKDNSPPGGYKYLIKAEDSSGRSSKIEITVQVNSITKWYDVKFRTSFINHMMSDYNADTMYFFSKLLTEYLDTKPNGNIYIHDYTYPSEITWSSCDIEKCQPSLSLYEQVRRKLITADKQASSELQKAMGPRFTITAIRIELKELGICGPIGPTIKPPPVGPNTTIPKCGYLTYRIPENYFLDLEGLTTREHTLNLLTLSGDALSISSNIQFNESYQYVYGVNTWINVQKYSSYQLVAQHPLSGYKLSTILTLETGNFEAMKRVTGSLCYIKFDMQSTYNEQITDVAMTYFFMEVFASYFKRDMSEIQIFSYQRYRKNSQTYFSVSFTNCTLTEIFIKNTFSKDYYNLLKIMKRTIFEINSQGVVTTTISTKLQNHFKSNSYFIISSVTFINCTQPPNPPPIAKKPWLIEVHCGYFEEKVPDDLFELHGRNLAEMLLKIDTKEEWFYLNITQYLVGVAKIDIVNSTSSREKQYTFNLMLTDTQGQSASTEVILTLYQTPISISQSTTSFGLMVENEADQTVLHLEVLLMQRIYYFIKENFPEKYDRQSLTISRTSSLLPIIPLIEISVRDCNCSAEANRILVEFDQSKVSKNREVYTNFIKSFPVSLTEENVRNVFRFDACQNVSSPPVLRSLPINYCEFWNYKLATVFGETITNYDLRFFNAKNEVVPKDNWIWLNNYTLEAFPPEDFWLRNYFQEHYTFEIHLSSGFDFLLGDPYFYMVYLNKSDVRSSTVDYSITLEEDIYYYDMKRPFDNHYISIVMNALVNLTGTNKNIHYAGFNILQYTPFQYQVKWENCSFIDCSSPGVEEVNSIIHNSKEFDSLNIVKYLPPNVKVIKLESKCFVDENPETNGTLKLNIPICGVFKKKVNFEKLISGIEFRISDYEINLRTHDLKKLERDTWINYNPTEQVVYALPTEAIVSVNQALHYNLELVDKKGVKVIIPVEITVEKNKKAYYEFSLGFTGNTDSNYLDKQIQVFQLISEWTENKWNIENFRVIEFTETGSATGETFYLRFGVCSYDQTICKSEEMDIISIENSMIDPPPIEVKETFKKFFIDKSNLEPFYAERRTPVLAIDNPPNTISELEQIILSQCQSKIIYLSRYIYDNEQNITTISLNLKFKNGSVVSNSYWVQISETMLLIYPYGNVQNGEYKFSLEATDKCRNTVTLAITVQIIRENIPSVTNHTHWKISLTSVTESNQPDVRYISYIKTNLIKYFSDSSPENNFEDDFYILSYSRASNQLDFTLCSILKKENCDSTLIFLIQKYLFITNTKQLDPSLQTYFKIYPIKSIKENINCDGPKCKNVEFSINLCGVFEYYLNDNVCNDGNSGTLKNLKLELLSENQKSLPQNYWLGLDKNARKLYGFPISGLKKLQEIEQQKVLIKATNEDNQFTYIHVTINLIGNRISSDIQLLTSIQNFNPLTTETTYDTQKCLMEKIKTFFSVSNISFNSVTQKDIIIQNDIGIRVNEYSWGFCERFTNTCDCISMKQKQEIFKESELNKVLQSCKNVQKTQLILSENCKNNNKPQLINGISEMKAKVGEYNEMRLPSDQFKDLEEGPNKFLHMNIEDFDDSKFKDLKWLHVEDNKVCGLMAYQEFVELGYTTETKVTYDVTATDSCGNRNSDEIEVTFTNRNPSLKYKIFLTLFDNYGEFSGNCSKIKNFSNAIESYTKIPSTEFFIQKFSAQNKTTLNGTNFEIKLPCENDDDEKIFEKFSTELDTDEKITTRQQFIEFMEKRGFDVKEFNDVDKNECESCWWCWWLPILIILILLILLLWLLWYCIPRCCGSCCSRYFPFCNSCCSKGGTCSSLRDNDNSDDSKITTITEEGGTIAPTKTSSKDQIDEGKGKATALDDRSSSGGTTQQQKGYSISSISSKNSQSSSGTKHSKESENLATGAIPLPAPYPTSGPQNIEYQTESWTDKRPLTKYVRRRTTSLDSDSKNLQTGRNNYAKNETIYETTTFNDRSYGKDYPDFFYTKEDRGYNSYDDTRRFNNYRITLPRPRRDTTSDDEYIRRKRIERGKSNFRSSRRNRSPLHVHARKPVTFRVRRSVLKDYLRRQGRSDRGKISLNDRDIRALLDRDATLKIEDSNSKKNKQRVIRTNSRIADALIDPSVKWDRKSSRRQQSRSTTSDDVTGINQYGNEVVISPRNITLTFDGSDIRTPTSEEFIPYTSQKRRTLFRRGSSQITPRINAGVTKRRKSQRSRQTRYDYYNKGFDDLRYNYTSF